MELDPEQRRKIDAFADRLYAANAVMNLTRIPRDEFQTKHVDDSLLVQEFVPENARVLDIGSGAGFPAWPMACVRSDILVTALDSSGKAIGFLETVPLPNLEAVCGRAEDWGVRDAFDVVTGRALAPLAIQLELSAAPCRVGGLVVPMRTPSDEAAAAAFPGAKLGLELVSLEFRTLAGTDIRRLFPIFRKVDPTPAKYPRKWAEIRRSPLG